jgi:hypothetical protein
MNIHVVELFTGEQILIVAFRRDFGGGVAPPSLLHPTFLPTNKNVDASVTFQATEAVPHALSQLFPSLLSLLLPQTKKEKKRTPSHNSIETKGAFLS